MYVLILEIPKFVQTFILQIMFSMAAVVDCDSDN